MKKYEELLESQWRTPKIIRDLEHLSSQRRLDWKEISLMHVNNLKSGVKRVALSIRTRRSGHKQKQKLLHPRFWERTLCWGWRSTGTSCPGRSWTLPLKTHSRPACNCSCVTTLGALHWHGVGLEDLKVPSNHCYSVIAYLIVHSKIPHISLKHWIYFHHHWNGIVITLFSLKETNLLRVENTWRETKWSSDF